jgi:N-acetylmuramoyl-L-alanine amidase
MKRGTQSSRKNTNSEGIRRGQQSGRTQATKSTQRITQYLDSDQPKGSGHSDDVSIAVPGKLRRYFAFGLLALIFLTLIYAITSNLKAWQGININSESATALVESTQQSVANRHIGIVSGHRGNDSGTVCKDGLTEAEVNYSIAKRVSEMFINIGNSVDILDEFDKRLKNYSADVLLSIHADSCAYINDLATGFKVARVIDSRVPVQEDHLVACLTSHYKQTTGLRFHANTVTFDMTKYHAFYEINPNTPAAIIETGFLYLDRDLLAGQPDLVAQGIFNGLECFLNDQQP